MAQIISKDRVPYRIWDKINGVWNKLNFTTNAKSVDADDGKTLQTKVGAINGITSDLSCEDESIAISAKAVNDSLTSISTNLSFPDGVGFYPDIQDGKRGYNTDAARGADTFFPFSTIFSEFDLSYISTSATKRVINVSEGNVVIYYTNATAFSTSGVIVDDLSIGNHCVLVCKGSGTLTIIPNAQTSAWIGGILR